LQELQAAHERIVKAMDADKDGTLTLEEMLDLMRGSVIGSAALGAGAPPSGRSHSAALMKACRTEPCNAVKNSSGRL